MDDLSEFRRGTVGYGPELFAADVHAHGAGVLPLLLNLQLCHHEAAVAVRERPQVLPVVHDAGGLDLRAPAVAERLPCQPTRVSPVPRRQRRL